MSNFQCVWYLTITVDYNNTFHNCWKGRLWFDYIDVFIYFIGFCLFLVFASFVYFIPLLFLSELACIWYSDVRYSDSYCTGELRFSGSGYFLDNLISKIYLIPQKKLNNLNLWQIDYFLLLFYIKTFNCDFQNERIARFIYFLTTVGGGGEGLVTFMTLRVFQSILKRTLPYGRSYTLKCESDGGGLGEGGG
jgi:hypothetical protein